MPLTTKVITLRFAATRIRRLREAHGFSKAELARRAALTPTEYLRFEPPTTKRRYGLRRVSQVPVAHLQQMALALGTTAEYLARGATDVKAVPPNHPARAMIAEMDRYGRELRNALLREGKLEHAVEIATNQRLHAEKLYAAMQAQRTDDAAFLLDLVENDHADMKHTTIARHVREAAERMMAGQPMRPDDEDDEVDPCPKGDPECMTGDDGSCHDACEAPPTICPHYPNTRPQDCGKCVSARPPR